MAHSTQRRASMSKRRQFFGEDLGIIGRQEPLLKGRMKSGLHLSHLGLNKRI